MAIVIGTSKTETLTGTALADSIFGRRGNDGLLGLGAADLLAGATIGSMAVLAMTR